MTNDERHSHRSSFGFRHSFVIRISSFGLPAMYFDTHAHLDQSDFDADRGEVICAGA